jgi:hypothetical protein
MSSFHTVHKNGKTLAHLGMGKFLSRERFGHPQFLAGMLLLIFLGQCSWLLFRGTSPLDVDSSELFRVQEGMRQWHRAAIAGTPAPERLEAASPPTIEVEQNEGFDPDHSPLWYLLASVAFAAGWGSSNVGSPQYWGWLARLPYIGIGLLLGASLWYVARRLYGNAGGYIALVLYCFSPLILRNSTLWLTQPEMGAAWGTFGAIFTAIAVAHTLYAPREVVLWNWRRIVLLGLSFALAVGCQFSLFILLPLSIALMVYVAHNRRRAALAIWAASFSIALLLIFAAYAFNPGVFWQGMCHARWLGFSWRGLVVAGTYHRIWLQLIQSGPALVIALPCTLATYAAWPRTRYFGNTVPLLLSILFLLLGAATPHYSGAGFTLVAIPFLFVFVAGIIADLLETRQRGIVLATVWGLLSADAMLSILQLLRVGRVSQ